MIFETVSCTIFTDSSADGHFLSDTLACVQDPQLTIINAWMTAAPSVTSGQELKRCLPCTSHFFAQQFPLNSRLSLQSPTLA